MFVLDTNVLSELRQPKRSSPKIFAWASSQPIAAQFVSVITILELELGVLQKERRDRTRRGFARMAGREGFAAVRRPPPSAGSGSRSALRAHACA
jgi:predicted nucleic acid-binding protein